MDLPQSLVAGLTIKKGFKFEAVFGAMVVLAQQRQGDCKALRFSLNVIVLGRGRVEEEEEEVEGVLF